MTHFIEQTRGIIIVDVEFDKENIVSVDYYYSDIYILRCIELGLFAVNRNSRETVQEKFQELRNPARYFQLTSKFLSKIENIQSIGIDPKVIDTLRDEISKGKGKLTFTEKELTTFIDQKLKNIDESLRKYIYESNLKIETKIDLTSGLFVRVKDVNALLSIMDFISIKETYPAYQILLLSKLWEESLHQNNNMRASNVSQLKGLYSDIIASMKRLIITEAPFQYGNIEDIIKEFIR